MKQLKKSGVYQASNVTFDPSQIEARSYKWWVFVKVIGGKVVFNEYPYSNTTRRHQAKVKTLMNDLGIKIDYVVSTRESLDHSQVLNIAIENINKEILDQQDIISSKHTKQVTKQRAQQTIIELNNKKQSLIKFINKGV